MSNGGFEYTIMDGDILSRVARRYNVSGGWSAIWNHTNNERIARERGRPEALRPGDRIWLPGASGNTESVPSGGQVEMSIPPPYRIRAEDGTSGPPTVVPVGGEIRLKAVHDEGAAGDWDWVTDSTRITLANANTDTVTVRAGNHVSPSVGAELVFVRFTPSGGEALPEISERVSVIHVSFAAAGTQLYGFDAMGGAAGTHPHLSVMKNGSTTVKVRVTGGVTGGVLHFTSDNTSVTQVTAPASPPAEFDLTVRGQSQDKRQTTIHARVESDTGPVIASLDVNVYLEMEYEGKVAKVENSRAASTRLSRPLLNVADAQNALNRYYQPAVCRVTLSDYSSTGDVVDVAFDDHRAGTLVLEAGRISTGEQAIRDALTGSGKKIVIVKNLAWLYKLDSDASAGDLWITMADHVANYMRYLKVGNTYELGTAPDNETIKVVSKSGTDIELEAELLHDHPEEDGIWWPLGGLSGNPAFVQEGSDAHAKIIEVIGHEYGHELISWLDVTDLTSLMHFSNSRTSQLIRFKNLPVNYTPPGGNECQWEKVQRTV